MTEMVERVAKVIWQKHHNGDWDTRMSYYRATAQQKKEAIERGVHPDSFDYNDDVENAFASAVAVLAAINDFSSDAAEDARRLLAEWASGQHSQTEVDALNKMSGSHEG